MKIRKSLLFITILSAFLAFLLFLVPNSTPIRAATTEPSSSIDTAPPGSNNLTSTQSPPTTTNTSTTTRKEIPITGLNSNNAVIKDSNGNVVSPTENFFTWQNYEISYNWSIADGIEIQNGDTSTVQLPSGMVASSNLSIPLYNTDGTVIGTFTIQNGQSTGTITFNDALSNTSINRQGTLSIISKGTSTDNGNNGKNWMFNKVGWVGGYDTTNKPNSLVWNIAFNPNEEHLTNVVITDTLGPNETYVPGSASAIAGSYNDDGEFISSGVTLNPTVTTDGNKVIFTFPEVNTAVDIYYRVNVTNVDPNNSNTWTNHATMGSSGGDYTIDASTSWGGYGTGNGENVGTVTLTKKDSTNDQTLAGAEFKLVDGDGNVIMSNVATEANGQLVIKNLAKGNYTLTEVKAPDGYTLNPTPISFSVPEDNSFTINLSASDSALTGSVVLKKLDSSNKQVIAGTTYNLLDSNGNVIKSGLKTDVNGELAVSDLPAGEYSFVETQPTEGYQANSDPINFTIVANQTTPVELVQYDPEVTPPTPTPGTGTMELLKSNEKNEPLPDAVYNLLDSNGNVLMSALTTDKNGKIVVPNLPVGSYSLVETTAPQGYLVNKDPIKFSITKGVVTYLNATDEVDPNAVTPPTNPGEPGTVNPPTEPGEVTPPTNPGEPGTVNPPTEPGEITPPTNPGEPGTVNPPTEPGEITPPTNPGEPGITNPPVEPEKPGTVVPPTEPETPIEPLEPNTQRPTPSPSNPSVTNPSTVNPSSPSGSNSLGTNAAEPMLPSTSLNTSSTPKYYANKNNKGTLPQTGNNSLFLIILGLFILLFITMRHIIKKLA